MSFELDEQHDELAEQNLDQSRKATGLTAHMDMIAAEVKNADAPFKAGEMTENAGERDLSFEK